MGEVVWWGRMKRIKIILGTIAVIGILMEGIEHYFAPSALLLESSNQYPEYLSWTRWIITLTAVVGCLYIDSKERDQT